MVFGKALDDLYEQCHNSFCNISTFVSTTTIARHNAYLADDKCFRHLLSTMSSLVGVRLACKHTMVSGEEGGQGSGGLGELKLAQARKRRVEDEVYRLLGTSYSEQHSSPILTIGNDILTECKGEDTLNDILGY